VNKIHLMGTGDILILFTDGLMEHGIEQGIPWFDKILDRTVREVKDLPAEEIYRHIAGDMRKHAPPSDDISFVIIKKN